MFWGARDAMKVAAHGTWPSIATYFKGERRNAMSRSFLVSTMLESMQAVPSEFWRQEMLIDPWKMVRNVLDLIDVITAFPCNIIMFLCVHSFLPTAVQQARNAPIY